MAAAKLARDAESENGMVGIALLAALRQPHDNQGSLDHLISARHGTRSSNLLLLKAMPPVSKRISKVSLAPWRKLSRVIAWQRNCIAVRWVGPPAEHIASAVKRMDGTSDDVTKPSGLANRAANPTAATPSPTAGNQSRETER